MTRSRRFRLLLVTALFATSSQALFPEVAAADNCGTAEDTCKGTFVGGATAAVGAGALALTVAGASRAMRGNRQKPPHWQREGDRER